MSKGKNPKKNVNDIQTKDITPSVILCRLEQSAKILSLIALPLIIAIIGYGIQQQISNNSIKKDYVAISVNILSDKKTSSKKGLRSWAVELLNNSSPVKMSPDVSKKLINGELNLSTREKALKAWKLWESGRYNEALILDRQAAEEGDRRSLKRLGVHYQKKNDYLTAIKYHYDAAQLGDTYSMYSLAKIYMTGGHGVKQDFLKAYKWSLIAQKGLEQDYDYPNKINNINDINDWLEKTKTTLSKEQIEKTKELARTYLRGVSIK